MWYAGPLFSTPPLVLALQNPCADLTFDRGRMTSPHLKAVIFDVCSTSIRVSRDLSTTQIRLGEWWCAAHSSLLHNMSEITLFRTITSIVQCKWSWAPKIILCTKNNSLWPAWNEGPPVHGKSLSGARYPYSSSIPLLARISQIQ